MYLKYFGLEEAPFSIAPDPRYLYMSRRHQEALAHLLYGVKNGGGGFVLLTGEVGAGKTTVCRCLLEQIPDDCDVAYIFNPKLTVEELLSTLCLEFGIDVPADNRSIKVFIDGINDFLLNAHARGRHAVLIIDEAQNLSPEVLEQMRLLTNLETNERKLLQIILLGQPELGAMLDRPELRQLAQRIVARYHLGSLNKAEVRAYVQHRLEVSGIAAGARQLIPDHLSGAVYRLSGGVPRLINVLCDRALLGTYVQGKSKVDRATLRQAAAEVFRSSGGIRSRHVTAAASLTLLAAAAIAFALQYEEVPANAPIPIAKQAPIPASKSEALPSLVERIVWPADIPAERSDALAFAALLRTWNVKAPALQSCREAEVLGYVCHTDKGRLEDLRQIDRPAVLLLRGHGDSPRVFSATLVGLNKHVATLVVGNSTIKADVAALAGQWTGRYTAIWRKPEEARGFLRHGDSGPAVAWMASQLARHEGRQDVVPTDLVFDDAMIRRVRQFQLSLDMDPDGTIGPKTLIRLAGDGQRDVPTLFAQGKGE